MKTQEVLIIFTRYPVPGKSKTRLIPALGPEGASDLHRRMTEDLVNRLRHSSRFLVEIHYAEGSKILMQRWLGADLTFCRQADDDLGGRMSSVLTEQNLLGRTVCLVGSDLPQLSALIIEEAFDALIKNDLVFGPARDGGYYLIGCRPVLDAAVIPKLFIGINWGQPDVLQKTKDIVASLNLTFHLLPTLYDIDTPEDLRHFGDHPDA